MFPCTRCSACCRLAFLVPGFPLETDEKGACVKLGADGLCTIYEDRPDICRIDNHISGYPTKTDAYRANAAYCNKAQGALGMGEEWRVVIEG